MKLQKSITYPATKETIHEYASKIFVPITRNECVTTIWVPMAGRSMWNKFIVENISFFEQELPSYKSYLFVYVEALDLTEESLNGYLQLIGRSILDNLKKQPDILRSVNSEVKEVFVKHGVMYADLLLSLKTLLKAISDRGLTTVLILGEFDELTFTNKMFFNNLKSLWVNLYPNLQYIFPLIKSVSEPEHILSWDELREPILQNIVYIPLRTGVDAEYTIDFFAKRDNLDIGTEFRKVILEECGGHPYMLKIAVRTFRNHGPFPNIEDYRLTLKQSYELNSVLRGIYIPRSENEKEVLKNIIEDKTIPEELTSAFRDLVRLGILRFDESKKVSFFSKLFNEYVIEQLEEEKPVQRGGTLDIDPLTDGIRFNGIPVDEQFTRQEYLILSSFLKNPDSIISRDDIGEVLWGEDSYQKYSDWAIDQLMSKLRKKLKKIGVDVKIVTLRGRGYKMLIE